MFLYYKKDSFVPLTYSTLLKYYKSLLSCANLPVDDVGLHSLCRAGALYMYESGLSLEDVRQAGDWQSMAALVYLTKPLRSRVQTGVNFVSSMLSTRL